LEYSIETSKLTKRFSVIKDYLDLITHPFKNKEIIAVHNINLKVRKGEVLGLLGSNGAGKTTLIKILCTLILPTSGTARVGGYDVLKEGKKIRRIIGYIVSEERSFYWRLTGRQNLNFFAKLNNIDKDVAEERIERLMDLMDLEKDLDRPFKDFSTGMKQKLAIARGLITDPEIIFMDEPTRSLDPIVSQDLRQLIREKLVKENNKTVIYATHNLSEVEEICDRIAVIDQGEIIALNTIPELKEKFKIHKSYVIKVKNQNNHFLERINDSDMFNNVKILSNRAMADEIEIEVQISNEYKSISHVIQKVLDMGGDVHTFYEKETSLESLYSRLLSTKNN